ncbi:MAG: glycosyltransferase family 2 protein [Deltaproteobacteria bacterium]|nr:glycosyltransferase family 2 protein [Deltaproteobacteria bacterium]
MTEVSVIIPTYNRANQVQRAVASVLSQTFNDYEIIVVDDGSSDRTNEALAPFKDHLVWITHAKNQGVSASRNTGIKASKTRLIAFLDSDDYWLPEKLDVQIRFFQENPGAVACQTEEIWIRNGRRANPRQKHLKPSGDIFVPSLKLCLVSPSAVMLKRSLLDQVGLFDEDFPVCEDYDLWLRISCRYPIHLIGRKLVVKQGGAPDQLSSSLKGMDRFRIMSMLKLIEQGRLNKDQKDAVLNELGIKCRIYGEGCLKRGKKEEGEYFLYLPQKIKNTD